MKITFFDRKFNSQEISIEKVFDLLRSELSKRKISHITIKNPYDFGLFRIIKGIFFFNRKRGKINHITGYIHWAVLLQSSSNTILTIHDIGRYWEISGWRRILYYYLWIYLPLRKAKYVTAISNKTKQDIVSLVPWAINKITVIPNCFTVPIEEKSRFDMHDIPKVLIVGTRSNKNIENSFQALKGLCVELTIIGELTKFQISLLNDYQINFINVKFISEEELINIYKASDILLFMSIFEGFGLPILEAQSQNCIVITSNLKPMNEVGGKAAIYADPLDINDIKSTLQRVISMNNIEHLKIINEGKINVKKFSVDSVTDQYIQLYKKINKSL